jgi:arylsulfatase A-like enzyme
MAGIGRVALRSAGAAGGARRRWRLGALVALALAASRCGDGDGGASLPDVLLITVDTLRADHVGAYGAELARTPVMDALAAEGSLFENASSPLPETRPSHFTLFTSRYPRDHGVLSNLAFPRQGLVALPALYGAAGYSTAAFVGCGLFDERARVTFGFDLLDAPEAPQRRADAVVPRAVAWLERVEVSRPIFLWLHLFDPHMPYEPPAGFDPAPSSPLADEWPEFTWPRLLRAAEANGGDLPGPLLERARDLYRGEVEHVDHWLGRLVEALRRRGRWQETLVVLTADHGECFADGVFFDHSQCLGEGALAVPLILRYPERVEAGRRVTTQVELLDIAPTLLRLSGLGVPGEFRGAGLLVRADGGSELDPLAFFERPHYLAWDVRGRNEVLGRLGAVGGEATRRIDPDDRPAGVKAGPWKYIVDGEGERLAYLTDDPTGRHGPGPLEPDKLVRLRQALRGWLSEYPVAATEDVEVDAERREELRRLGYF